MGKKYRMTAYLLMMIILCTGFIFATGKTVSAAEVPATRPVTTHEPQTYVAEYKKGDSDNTTVLEIRNETAGTSYESWNDLPLLFPGDVVTIIPRLPSEAEALRNNNESTGVGGLIFSDYTIEDKYPIHVTSVADYGSSVNWKHGATFIQRFEVIGDGPVKLVSNGGNSIYTSEQVETMTWTNDVRNIITQNYGAFWIDFKYYPAWNRVENHFIDEDTTNQISSDTIAFFGEKKAPDAIWAVDAINNLSGNNASTVLTMGRPYAEGYRLSGMTIKTQSMGYDRPHYYWDSNTVAIIPRWADNSKLIPEGYNFKLNSYEDECTVIEYTFCACRTITLDANGGTIDGQDYKVYEIDGEIYGDDEVNGGLDNPQWGSKAFLGWYRDRECTIPAKSLLEELNSLNENSTSVEDRSCHLYAGWREKGWITEDGKTYYVDDNGDYYKGMIQFGEKAYYFDEETGVMLTSCWVKINEAMMLYFDDDGKLVLYKLIADDGTEYILDREGNPIETSPIGIPGTAMTGWQYLSGHWYYMNTYGLAMTGWQRIDGKWYYLGQDGIMQTGWLKWRGKWYYLASNGVMQTGWKLIDGTWYYLKANGEMAAGEYWRGYWLNKNGAWTYKPKASWHKSGCRWWYGDTTGWYAKNATYRINGTSYTFDKDGYCVNP